MVDVDVMSTSEDEPLTVDVTMEMEVTREVIDELEVDLPSDEEMVDLSVFG